MVFNNIIINDTLYGFNDGYFWSDTIDPGIGSVLLLERTIIENDSKVVALYNFNNNAYQKVDIENDTLDPLWGRVYLKCIEYLNKKCIVKYDYITYFLYFL